MMSQDIFKLLLPIALGATLLSLVTYRSMHTASFRTFLLSPRAVAGPIADEWSSRLRPGTLFSAWFLASG